MMIASSTSGCLEEFGIVGGLITIQFVYAVYGVFMSHLLSLGLRPLFVVIYGSFSTFITLFPFAISFERRKWQRKFKPMLLLRFVVMAVGGVTIFQSFMLMGLKNTSPTIASAMPSLIPGLVFIIAGCLRFEKIDPKCTYSRAKVVGTLVCLAGALSMSFFQNRRSTLALTSTHVVPLHPSSDVDGNSSIIGCMYLLTAVFVVSFIVVLQAATLNDFPAPFTVCAFTSLFGSIITGLLQWIQEGTVGPGSDMISAETLLVYAFLGGTANGLSTAFQAWAVTKRGPVLVSLFSPIGTVVTAILSAFTIGEGLSLGSITGMLLMFAGLYVVLWAKKGEGYCTLGIHDDKDREICDAGRPLLS